MPNRPLTDRDVDTLHELEVANINLREVGFRHGWARAMDCGGSNRSHHSKTLKKLVRRGLAEVASPSQKRPGSSIYYRGGCGYKITEAGIALLDQKKPNRRSRSSGC